jgi:hypothetical protein
MPGCIEMGRSATNCVAGRLVWGAVNIEQPVKFGLERATGLEPATSSLGSWHSTTELRPHYISIYPIPPKFQTRRIALKSHGGYVPPRIDLFVIIWRPFYVISLSAEA